MAISGRDLMRVADFFCGAGGFSEGFRQAGFKITFAIDNWLPAVTTFRANKPEANVILDDVIRISELPDSEFEAVVPDTEVIIGSPPCIAFSNSNKSGNGDKTLGIKLVEAYLRIVARKKFKPGSILKYWVLENVPNLRKFIKEVYSARDLGLPGECELKILHKSAGIYNAKYFGAPTNRKRFLCGEFPCLQETHNDCSVLTLQMVLDSLGLPLAGDREFIIDCNYPELRLPLSEVTDHQYLYVLQPFEWKKAKRLKEDRGYMGKMAFPERLNRPSRTVMATMSSSSRESMILGFGNNQYRLPTVREVASMMSFPIDYKFYGKSKGIKYTLVGNAVPPKLSYAIAVAILAEQDLPIPKNYRRIVHDATIKFFDSNYISIPPRKEKTKRPTAKFKYHIPYLIVNSYRVELTNYHSDFSRGNLKWDAEIHYSQGKDRAKCYDIDIKNIPLEPQMVKRVQEFLIGICPELCSASEFQKRHCMTEEQRLRHSLVGPFELLAKIRKFLDLNVSKNDYDKEISISVEPFKLPYVILVGYYVIKKIVNFIMED